MIYTNIQLTQLVHNSPKELYKILINPNTDVKILVIGVELLCGEISDESLVLPILRILLKHVNALVRESAMIGVTDFYKNKKPPYDLFERLKFISTTDPSPNLRFYAKDILENMMS